MFTFLCIFTERILLDSSWAFDCTHLANSRTIASAACSLPLAGLQMSCSGCTQRSVIFESVLTSDSLMRHSNRSILTRASSPKILKQQSTGRPPIERRTAISTSSNDTHVWHRNALNVHRGLPVRTASAKYCQPCYGKCVALVLLLALLSVLLLELFLD